MQEKQASAERIGAHCTFGVGLRSLCLEMGLTRTFIGKQNTTTVFPHIVSAETILFWIQKSKGHST